MVNYQLGKIYRIVDFTDDNVYIGSTCEKTLAHRLAKHVQDYKRYINEKFHFVTSFKILENNNYDIQLIEAFPCNSRDELHQREGYHIKNTPNCINKCIPGRTKKDSDKQYYENNKVIISVKCKQYYDDNKDKINEQRKQNTICICGSEFRKADKSKHEKSQKHKSFIQSQQVTVN
jgi:hypothetical protein